MKLMDIVGLNVKWYRYQASLTQEKFAEIANFKMAYVSIVENGEANLTLNNIEIIAKALVDNPDEVVVTETEKDKAIIVDLKVAPSDMGKVIGKSGRIAKSIRSVVSAAASKTNKNVIVEINN